MVLVAPVAVSLLVACPTYIAGFEGPARGRYSSTVCPRGSTAYRPDFSNLGISCVIETRGWRSKISQTVFAVCSVDKGPNHTGVYSDSMASALWAR